MVSEKKEIVYNNINHFAVIVAAGVYRNVKYVCLNLGIHPAAYVMCSQEFLDKHVDEYETIEGIHVHCGITYVGNANELLGLEEYNSPCFGWDYGHAGDWAGYMSEEENIAFGHTKYTTNMLIKDCQDAIDQYLQILENDAHPVDENILTKETLSKFQYLLLLEYYLFSSFFGQEVPAFLPKESSYQLTHHTWIPDKVLLHKSLQEPSFLCISHQLVLQYQQNHSSS